MALTPEEQAALDKTAKELNDALKAASDWEKEDLKRRLLAAQEEEQKK